MKKLFLLLPALFLLCVGLFAAGWFFVASDPLQRTDVVVPLRGSIEEGRVRLDEAAQLVKDGYASTLLVSVSAGSYYNQPVRTLVQAYLEQKGFPKERVEFCDNSADSTIEEGRAILTCLRQLGAKEGIKNAMIVTSEYHSRRARFLVRRAFQGSGITAYVHPVYNRNYWSTAWWMRRRWAKTFVIELLSWGWNGVEQAAGWVRSEL